MRISEITIDDISNMLRSSYRQVIRQIQHKAQGHTAYSTRQPKKAGKQQVQTKQSAGTRPLRKKQTRPKPKRRPTRTFKPTKITRAPIPKLPTPETPSPAKQPAERERKPMHFGQTDNTHPSLQLGPYIRKPSAPSDVPKYTP